MAGTVFDHIAFQARLKPGALAVHGLAGPVSFAQLVRDVEGLATELMERGLTQADMVGLNVGFSYLHVLLVLALDRLGIASMSFATVNPATAPAVLPQFGLTAAITAGAPVAIPSGRCIELRDEHRPRIGAADAARLAQLAPAGDQLMRVTWTSGTTGTAKGSPMDRAIQQLRLEALRKLRALGPGTRYFAIMPLSSGYCYAMALAVLCAGGALILPNPTVDFVTQANTFGATASGAAPGTLLEILGQVGTSGRRLETMIYLDAVGAHLPSRTARDVMLHLTPNLRSTYGSTEGGWAATGDAALCVADPGAVGYVIPWMAVQAVDAADRPLPAGGEGSLRIRGAQVVMRYHGDEATSQRVFRDGWFYPGDLGMVTADGLVRVTGRIEDVILRGGAMVSPLPIEEAIGAQPQVREVAVFALPGGGATQEIWAALVLEPGADARAVVAAAALGDRAPTKLMVAERLPRNPNGKVVRRVLAEWAIKGGKP